MQLFTVATITYNSANWIKYTIESVLCSTYKDFEFIISDDCSTDETWEIIKSYKDPRIKASRNENNIGEYPNRNKVLAQTCGDFIFYVDGDDILYKDTLQNLHNYLQAFKDVGMIWGVHENEFDFVVFPYLFAAEQMAQMIFFTNLSATSIGLGETVFNTELLKSIGGFSLDYAIGDTYIKRCLALISNVLLVPSGLSFWRRSSNQASKRATNNYRSFLDLHYFNKKILDNYNLPLNQLERQQAATNIKISEIKLLVSNTLLKGKLKDFFFLCKKIEVSLSDFKYLMRKGKYNYKPVENISYPLMNYYNFNNA